MLTITFLTFLFSFSTAFLILPNDETTRNVGNVSLRAGCNIIIKQDFSHQHPILLDVNKNEFVEPNNQNVIEVSSGTSLRVSCPGSNIINTDYKETTIKCVSGKKFILPTETVPRDFKAISCTNYPTPTAKRSGNKCANNKFAEINIGFETNKGFVPLFKTCLDDEKKNTIYSIHKISPNIRYQQFAYRPEEFIVGNFYNGLPNAPNYLYRQINHKRTIGNILGSPSLVTKYMPENTDYYLSRGHLTPFKDFIYAAQQRATFFYVNVAPQWQTSNGGNWNEIEISCRNLARDRNTILDIYTGVYGQDQLPNNNNILTNLALYQSQDKQQKLTVPKLYWKIVHEPKSNKGVVIITHNNPHKDSNTHTPICENVSSNIKWIQTWIPSNVTLGLSYACTYETFKQVVDYVPNILINGLLV